MFYLYLALSMLGVIIVLGLLAFAVLTMLGKRIPVEHTATSHIIVPAAPGAVYDAIADVASHPSWAKGTTRVQMLPDKDGRQHARVHVGRNSFALLRTRHEPPTLLERTISDERGPFSGTWLYKLAPAAASAPGREGTEVRLTETGRVSQPFARAIMKHIVGYHTYTHRHLQALARKFGRSAKAHRA